MGITMQDPHEGNYVRIDVTGSLTKSEYEEFLPKFEALIRSRGKLRALVVMKEFRGFDLGAAWEDIKFAVKNYTCLEKLAVVGDTKWEQWMTTFWRPFSAAEVRYFDISQEEAAADWLGYPRAGSESMPDQTESPTRTAVPPIQTDTLVAVYGSHGLAEAAIKSLQHHGFDITKLSIVGKDYHTDEHVVGYYTTGDRMRAWGTAGAFWGGLWGLLFGAFFLVPGIGPVLVAGPLVAWIVGALEGAAVVGGLSVLGAALVSIGIPEDRVLKYETDLRAGKYLLFVHGTQEEIARANALLELTDHEGLSAHQA